MKIVNDKIELTTDENEAFVKQMKIGIAHQLHKDKLLAREQLKSLLNSINK